MIGRTIDHFRITAELGRGGMGVVYEAEDLQLKRLVALKFLSSQLMASEEARTRFLHEAQAASSLEHPAICSIFAIGETDDGQTYVVMPRYRGRTLEDRLALGPVPSEEAVAIITQVAQGLGKAHQTGIVHRDIKPANIFLTDDGQAVILDFGLAKLAGATVVTQDGTTLGTGAYMAPEQVNQGEVDARTDLWAVGVVLYEMLTGERPFKGDHIPAVLYAIVHEEPPSLADGALGVPTEIAALVHAVLAKGPEDRPATAEAFLALLEGKAELRGRVVRRNQAAAGLRIPPFALVGAGCLVLALVLLWAWTWWMGRKQDAPSGDEVVSVVAVLPFSYNGTEEYAYLQSATLNLLTGTLDGLGGRRTVPAHTVLDISGRLQGEGNSASEEELARRLGASSFVTGSIVEAGGRLRVTAELHRLEVDSGSVLRSAVNGSPDNLFTLVDELAGLLFVSAADQGAEGAARLSATTGNLEALKAYLEGDRLALIGDADAARAEFERAVAIDSTFALAWFRLSMQGLGSYVNDRTLYTSEMAARFSDNLPNREKLLFRGWRAYLRGDIDQAEQQYRVAEQQYPSDTFVLRGLMSLLWVYNPFRGRDKYEALPYARRLLELDGQGRGVAHHYVTTYAVDKGDWGFVEKNKKCQEHRLLCILTDFIKHFDESPSTSLAELDTIYDYYLRHFELFRSDPEMGLAMAQRMVDDRLFESQVPHGFYRQACLNLARGRRVAARKAMGRWRTAPESTALGPPLLREAVFREFWGFGTAMPYLEIPRVEIDSLVTDLDEWPAARTPDKNRPEDGCHLLLKHYLMGLLEAKRGDWGKVLEHAAVMDTVMLPHRVGSSGVDLACGLRAREKFHRGDLEGALAEMEAAPRKIGFGIHWASDYQDQALERMLLGDILFSMERYEEAWSWYLAAESYSSLLFYPIQDLKLARTEVKLGRIQEAADHYDQFIAYWEKCDPDQRRLLEEAKAERAALGI